MCKGLLYLVQVQAFRYWNELGLKEWMSGRVLKLVNDFLNRCKPCTHSLRRNLGVVGYIFCGIAQCFWGGVGQIGSPMCCVCERNENFGQLCF